MAVEYKSKIVAALTGVAIVLTVVATRFARGVFVGMIERMGGNLTDVSRLTSAALALTSGPSLAAIGLAGLAAVVVAELRASAETGRLTVHALVLVILLTILVVALSGFFVSFYIPNVNIP